jgi:hypothetical protein
VLKEYSLERLVRVAPTAFHADQIDHQHWHAILGEPLAQALSTRFGPVDSAIFENELGSWRKNLDIIWDSVAGMRTVAIALAMRLYQIDHTGLRPASLSDLVPCYLPSVPQDPFMADGTPILYYVFKHGLPDGSDRPMLRCGPMKDPWQRQPASTPSYGPREGTWQDLSHWYGSTKPK